MKNNRNKLVGSNPPEAWAVASKHDPKTCISIPPEDSVIEAKQWVDENQK